MNGLGISPVRHRLSADVVQTMAEAGIFRREERIELIEGDLIDTAPIGPDHEAAVGALNETLVLACARRAIVWPQNSIRLTDWSAPEPDLVVLRRRADFYRTGERAGPSDVLLLIEVADSSLQYDRTVKMPLYTGAGIAEFWLVDLERRVLEAYRKPAGDSYREASAHSPAETLALMLAPDILVSLDLVFG